VREYTVTLRSGKRYTVKAERITRDRGYVAFVVSTASIGTDPLDGVVAMFDEKQVAVVVARDNLVSEEKGEPIDPHYVADDGDSEIPF